MISTNSEDVWIDSFPPFRMAAFPGRVSLEGKGEYPILKQEQ